MPTIDEDLTEDDLAEVDRLADPSLARKPALRQAILYGKLQGRNIAFQQQEMLMPYIPENNHYNWLDMHFPTFLKNVGVDPGYAQGLIRGHGDKCYLHRESFKDSDIHFFHGVAIYLLTYCSPFSRESRETDKGWVDPFEWVINNKDRFLPHLPPIV